ncbi:TlpA family protein disulfide reductase [Taklimakanibacter lacteus]|uniref:TlpA family protein disulfide reductase n=1 Tax=Taklimakanibacter lacteus TaxID=2268456 RepID=UPI000E66EC07
MRSLAVALFAVVLAFAGPALGAEAPQNFVVHQEPKALPELRFKDGDGRPKSLSDFNGKVVLLNVWATWCGPCRKEMPTLDRLQAGLGGPGFEVVVLSIDRAGIDVVRKFFGEIGIKNLTLYIDEGGKALRELGIFGLPATLLIDREGREIGRLVGPADWDTPEMVAFIRGHLGQNSCSEKTEQQNVPAADVPPGRDRGSAPAPEGGAAKIESKEKAP